MATLVGKTGVSVDDSAYSCKYSEHFGDNHFTVQLLHGDMISGYDLIIYI